MVHLMEDESKSGRHIVPVEYVRSSVSNTQDVIDAVKRAKREIEVTSDSYHDWLCRRKLKAWLC